MARRSYGGARPFFQRFWARVSILLLVLLAVAFLLMGRNSGAPGPFSALQRVADDAASPVMHVINMPYVGVRKAFAWVGSFWNSAARVRQLEAENRRLQQWESLSRALHAKLVTYESLLAMQGEQPVRVVSARLVAETHGPFVRSSLLRVGSDEGVHAGQAVVVPGGMIGRVVSAGNHSARVLLLTDLNSRVPVMLEGLKTRAMLAGDNTDFPRLEYIRKDTQVAGGIRVVTSGDDGILPEGLAVGEVIATVGPNQMPRVRLYADMSEIDYVQVLGLSAPKGPKEDTQIPALATANPDADNVERAGAR